MLRLNDRSRSRIKKNKHSKNLEKNTQEKLKYEEDYNEIILNDLVSPEDREEFGLDNESNTKKQGGLKLNISLGSKNRPKKKYNHNKNQQKDSLDEIESVNNKEELSENIVETNKTEKSQKSKKRPNYKKKSNDNKKNQSNENLKNNKLKSKNNKANQNNEDENKNHHVKKTHKQNSSEKNQKKVKKNENNTKETTNVSYEKTKDSNKKIVNNKKRKRPNIDKQETEDELRILDDKKIKSEIEVKENSQDITTFRGNENIIENANEEYKQKASEIKEVHNKFGNIVWSEDKFPKK